MSARRGSGHLTEIIFFLGHLIGGWWNNYCWPQPLGPQKVAIINDRVIGKTLHILIKGVEGRGWDVGREMDGLGGVL